MFPGSVSHWYMLHSIISQNNSSERLSKRALQVIYRKLDLEKNERPAISALTKKSRQSPQPVNMEICPQPGPSAYLCQGEHTKSMSALQICVIDLDCEHKY